MYDTWYIILALHNDNQLRTVVASGRTCQRCVRCIYIMHVSDTWLVPVPQSCTTLCIRECVFLPLAMKRKRGGLVVPRRALNNGGSYSDSSSIIWPQVSKTTCFFSVANSTRPRTRAVKQKTHSFFSRRFLAMPEARLCGNIWRVPGVSDRTP